MNQLLNAVQISLPSNYFNVVWFWPTTDLSVRSFLLFSSPSDRQFSSVMDLRKPVTSQKTFPGTDTVDNGQQGPPQRVLSVPDIRANSEPKKSTKTISRPKTKLRVSFLVTASFQIMWKTGLQELCIFLFSANYVLFFGDYATKIPNYANCAIFLSEHF